MIVGLSKATNVSTSIELHKGSVANRGPLLCLSLCSGGLQNNRDILITCDILVIVLVECVRHYEEISSACTDSGYHALSCSGACHRESGACRIKTWGQGYPLLCRSCLIIGAWHCSHAEGLLFLWGYIPQMEQSHWLDLRYGVVCTRRTNQHT